MKTMFRQNFFRTGVLGIFLLFITIQGPAKVALSKKEASVSKGLEINDALPIGLNKNVTSFVNHYLKQYHLALVVAKKRSGTIFPVIDSVFKLYDLPVELKYLAVVESYLATTVKSQSGAAGIWQLMPTSAKILGLNKTTINDERLQVSRSSVAAAKYLKQLYDEFGDWLLAIAAYNAGSGRIHRAIKQAGCSDFWLLQNYLPTETRNHVKRFIGVHYFFEGQGSIATLTKKETDRYMRQVAELADDNSGSKTESNKPS
jgi:membrane-bound lytic murein transglycosylase D